MSRAGATLTRRTQILAWQICPFSCIFFFNRHNLNEAQKGKATCPRSHSRLGYTLHGLLPGVAPFVPLAFTHLWEVCFWPWDARWEVSQLFLGKGPGQSVTCEAAFCPYKRLCKALAEHSLPLSSLLGLFPRVLLGPTG